MDYHFFNTRRNECPTCSAESELTPQQNLQLPPLPLDLLPEARRLLLVPGHGSGHSRQDFLRGGGESLRDEASQIVSFRHVPIPNPTTVYIS